MINPFQQNKIEKLRDIFNKSPKIKRPSISQATSSIKGDEYNINITTTETAYLKTKTKRFIDIKNFSPIFFCIYRIRKDNNNNFLEYLLYKYPEEKGDVCIFPFVKDVKTDLAGELENMMVKKLKKNNLKWNFKGYIKHNHRLFLFIKLIGESPGPNLTETANMKRSDKWWWCLIDEICNQRSIVNFPIHEIVTKLFLHNPLIIYLKDTQGIKAPIPRSLYYGNSAQMIPFNFVFGPKPRDFQQTYGPYYYLGSYEKAIRFGGWSTYYTPRNQYGMNGEYTSPINIADKNGKMNQGGIVRYAVFLGDKLKVLLNHPEDKITNINKKLVSILPFEARLIDQGAQWVQNKYTSLYYGRAKIPAAKNAIWNGAPGFVTKQYTQQFPLTFHIIDKKTLGNYWDFNYDKYYIE